MKPILLSQASSAAFHSSAARKRAAFFEDLCESPRQIVTTAESSNSVNLEEKVEKSLKRSSSDISSSQSESLQQLDQKNDLPTLKPEYADKSPLLLLSQQEVTVEPPKSKFFSLRKNGATLIFEKVQKRSGEDAQKRHSLQWDVLAKRKDLRKYRHSWYAYSHPEESEEESAENLAGAKRKQQNGQPIEAASLLEHSSQAVTIRRKQQDAGGAAIEDNSVNSLGAAAVPRRKRIEQFFTRLVGKRVAREPTILAAVIASPVQLESVPKSCPVEGNLRLSDSTSSLTLDGRHEAKLLNSSSTSLSSTSLVQQTLWSVLPLLNRRERSSCGNLLANTRPHPVGLRKCETVLALTHTAPSGVKTKIRAKSINNLLEPIKPQNRLRNSASCFNALAAQQTCSRCSSLLSLAAAGSKYSLNVTNHQFVNHRPDGSTGCLISEDFNAIEPYEKVLPVGELKELKEVAEERFTCKLCLGEHSGDDGTQIASCGCAFCTECMRAYVEFEITEGAYEVSCPDAMCPSQGVVSISEIALLASSSLVAKHHRYRLNREVELDKFRTWCPKAGCETICLVGPLADSADLSISAPASPSTSSAPQLPRSVHCPTCEEDFCSGCKKEWHPIMNCEENARRLAANGQSDSMMIFDSDLIKCCPMCAVPIEKDEGCAQMMCKRCKHVFCWYCLASLDDDFLLRHYDKGPCKNKLGHSRASVVWHRAQVIGIFAGFGILLLVASPLLLLAAPCIVCCKCRICSGTTKMEEAEADYDDAIGLQR